MKRLYTLFWVFLLSISIANSQRWEEIETIPIPYNSNYWLDVFFHPSNPNYGWVCGFNGMVIRTTDGGESWAGSYVPGIDHLEHIHFPTFNVGYTSGPEGIYKSTNGGQTWTDVTPNPTRNYWGNYFINENVGFVIGGGCVDDQSFYRTTNGGSTWSLFSGTVPNSGLTDLIVYDETRLGYAVSSGKLWVTLDGGITWSVFADSGSNLWNEELTNIGSSFLLPYAGSDCSGQGGGGGMRFTTDMGLSWNTFSTGSSMFGSYLLSVSNGWACGDDRNVLQTTDAGITWKIKNCGIKDGASLDDIWFVDPQLGFVVGSGVYKLSDPDYRLSKDTILFDNICLPETNLDSLVMEHFSFETSDAEFEIIDNPGNHFELISPNSYITLASCDLTKIIVRFSPKDENSHTARLRIKINPNTSDEIIKYVELIGNVIKSTAFPQDTLLILDRLVCNTIGNISVPWFIDNPIERIIKIDKLYNSNYINFSAGLPFVLKSPATSFGFTIQLPDTGWYEERFRFYVEPCLKDTSITVRAYGISPIISHNSKSQLNSQCFNEVLDTIRIFNTGNMNLDISSIGIVPAASEFKIIGWLNANPPISIPKSDYADLIVSYSPKSLGTHQANLVVLNNDSTKIHGDKNPYNISLKGVSQSVILSDSIFVDFGDICLGQTKKLNSRILNTGNIDAILQVSNLPANITVSLVDINNMVRKQDSVTLNITIDANKKGAFRHIVTISSTPCNEAIYLVITGRVVSNEFAISPSLIKQTVKVGESYRETVSVSSLSDIDINIKSIRIEPATTDWTYSFSPNVPMLLLPSQGTNFDFEFTPLKASNFKGRIVIETVGICSETYYVDLDLSSFNRMVEIEYLRDSVYISCEIDDPRVIPFEIRNKGFSSDTVIIVRIEPENEIISLYYPINTPFFLEPGKYEQFLIQFAPKQEGIFKANLIIETKGDDGQKFDYPLTFEYRESRITPLKSTLDFGIKEKCSADETLFVEYFNSGTLTDTIDLNKLPNNSVFEVIGDSWVVPSGGSVRIEIKVRPEFLESYGDINDNVSFISRVCYYFLELDLKVKSVKPILSSEPNPVDFGEKWSEEKVQKICKLKNLGDVDVKIDKISLSDVTAFEILSDAIGKVIKVGEELEVVLEYTSKNTGTSAAILNIAYSSDCADSIQVALSGKVREEIYSNLIYIDKYEANAGDSIDIEVKLRDGIERLDATRIDFQIEFDKMLFYPSNMAVRFNNRFEEIIYSYNSGVISGFLNDEHAMDLLKQSGDILKIRGVVLASLPDNTDLVISRFDVSTEKNLSLEKQNGHLKLINYCEETVRLSNYSWLPWFRIKSGSIAYFGNFNFEINTTKDIPVNYRITDILGVVQQIGSIYPGRTYSKETIELRSLSSGNYFIIFETQYQSEIINIIHLK